MLYSEVSSLSKASYVKVTSKATKNVTVCNINRKTVGDKDLVVSLFHLCHDAYEALRLHVYSLFVQRG